MKFASERNRAAARGSSAPLLTLMATCRLGKAAGTNTRSLRNLNPTFGRMYTQGFEGNAVHGFHMLSFLVVRMLFGRSLWIPS